MNQCPKCNSINISRPVWTVMPYAYNEVLVYTCLNCGYAENRPCADASRERTAGKTEEGEGK